MAVEGHEHVVRGHVAVNELHRLPVLPTGFVRVMQTRSHLRDHVRRERERHASLALVQAPEHAVERLAVQVLHRQEPIVAKASELEDLRDVGVMQLRRDARFVEEHRDEVVFFGEVRVDAFDRDPLLEPTGGAGSREVHRRHAARAELGEDLEARARVVGRRRRRHGVRHLTRRRPSERRSDGRG
ncbi:MAG: hypothetical protein R3B99_25440 [Polyangiales bacterium]